MPVECVTFDLDDTLWEIGPVIARAENRYNRWLQEKCPRVFEIFSAEDLQAERTKFFDSRPDLHHDLWRLRRGWMTDIVLQSGYEDPDLEEGFTIFWNERNNVTFFSNAIEVLEHTANHYSVGAITNGNADLKQIGIDNYFDFLLASAEVGVGKPDPGIFESAIQHADCTPGHIVHVGDDPERDVRGAARMGMRTVWVNADGLEWEGQNPPDATIVKIAELPETLRSLAQ